MTLTIRKSGELLTPLLVSTCKYGSLALLAQEFGCGSEIRCRGFCFSPTNQAARRDAVLRSQTR